MASTPADATLHRIKRLVLLLVAVVAFCVPASALAAKSLHEIDVYGPSGKVLAKFPTAKCLQTNGEFSAKAVSTNGKFKLAVRIFEFHDFLDEYEILQGQILPQPGVLFGPVSSKSSFPTYANYIRPPFEAPGFGEVVFREAGLLMGVGYGPAMYSRGEGGENAVFLTGVAECEYPKKGKKGKA